MSGIIAFVLNDARHDSRVLREAVTLAAAGHVVTIVARTVDPLAAAAERSSFGGVPLVRVPVARGPLRWVLQARRPTRLAADVAELGRRDPLRLALVTAVTVVAAVPLAFVGAAVLLGAATVRAVPPVGSLWRGVRWRLSWHFAVLPWSRAAAEAGLREAPGATIFWAHDMRALPAAIAAHRAAAGGSIVYDAHEIFPEAGENATRPGWARRQMASLERVMAREAAALVTVNDALAERLGATFGLSRVVVAHNCPPRWVPPDTRRGSLLRAAAEISSEAPVLLYHGGLAPGRGIEALASAMDQPGLEEAHLVFMGAGPSRPTVVDLAAASGGRIHLLDPVGPDELLAWVSGADVVMAPIQPTTLNHQLSSPNKVFEAIAAGVPVVGSDLPGIRSVILADPGLPLGAVADPDDPVALAKAVRSILELGPEAAAELRARCLAAAFDRWNWETESVGIVALAAELSGSLGQRSPTMLVPQRVCFVLASSGAFDSRTLRLAKGFADRGHDVTIIARAAADLPVEETPHPSVRLMRVNSRQSAGAAPAKAGAPRLVGEALRIISVIRQVRQQGQSARALGISADVFHAMGFLALPIAVDLARRNGSHLVYDARDLYVESNNIARLPGPLRGLFAWREGRWARRADRVLTVNDSCADYLERRYRLRRPVVVMNGQAPWEAPIPAPDHLRERLGIAPDRRIALYHGGFMPDRGLPQIIAAAGEPDLVGVEVVLMGGGSMEQRLRELAAASSARERIRFLPAVPPADVLAWVASADVGVMPNQPTTLNERLSTPNKLFECLMAGTPVVSSDFPERRRIVADGPDGPLGRLCDPTSPTSIAGAIREILDLPPYEAAAMRERCARAARERFGWSSQMSRAIAAYAELTGRPW